MMAVLIEAEVAEPEIDSAQPDDDSRLSDVDDAFLFEPAVTVTVETGGGVAGIDDSSGGGVEISKL